MDENTSQSAVLTANAARAAQAIAAGVAKEAERIKDGRRACITVTGRIVPVGTMGYRPLEIIPPNEYQHGVAGSHHNIFIANQNPRGPRMGNCFWQKENYVLKPAQLPASAVPVEPFVN